MKLISSTYTFTASAKTITCTDFSTYGLANILLICNVTRGVVIYNPSAAATKGTLSSSTLTLTYDTTSHSNADVLQIFVDNSATGSTAALQTTGNTSLSSIDTKTPALSSGRVPVDGSGVTQPVSASSLPLPTGAATSAAQTTGNASLASIDSKAPSLVSGRLPIDGSGVIQPVSGTFWQATQPVSIATMPTTPVSNASLTNIDTDVGALADAAAASDGTGNYSLISAAKRHLLNFATLLSRVPTLGSATGSASVPVVIASDQATVPVNQAGTSATGSISALNSNLTTGTATANSALALSLNGATGWAVDVRGTFVGTITFQGTIDGSTWFSINAIPAGGSVNVAAVSTTAAVGAWISVANGMQQVRATFSAYTSGSATVVLRAMQATGLVQNFPTGQTTQPVSGTVTATVASTTLAAATANAGYVGLQLPLLVADVASAALTTTTTTGTLTPAFGTSYQVNIPVTVVSGTTPTLDVAIEESDDTGTNWFKVYDFPRITATGMYRSPPLPNVGNRVRYVQTLTGTTPSFTRAINRLQRSDSVAPIRQLIDRTVTLTTLSSTTPSLTVQGTRNAQLVVNVGAVTTTAPALQLQGSDDNGTTWYSIGSPLTAVASSTVQLTVTNVQAQLLRAIVSTAGVGVTAGYVMVKGF